MELTSHPASEPLPANTGHTRRERRRWVRAGRSWSHASLWAGSSGSLPRGWALWTQACGHTSLSENLPKPLPQVKPSPAN